MVHRTVQPREARRPLLDAVFEARHADLSPEVRPLIENVYRQIEEITDRYGVAGTAAFVEMLSAATQRELFAAEKDVVRLSQLVERLEYLWKEHKEVERAFAMRKQAVEMRSIIYDKLCSTHNLDVPARAMFAEAQLIAGEDVAPSIANLEIFFASHLRVNGMTPECIALLRSLGARGLQRYNETLQGCSDLYAIDVNAMYVSGVSDKAWAADELADIRRSIKVDTRNSRCIEQLVTVAAAERIAGLDNGETLAFAESLRSKLPSSYDFSVLGLEYARSGNEAKAREFQPTNMREDILYILGVKALEAGDEQKVGEILSELEQRAVIGDIDAYRDLRTRRVLLWLKQGDWVKLDYFGDEPPAEHLRVVTALCAEDVQLATEFCGTMFPQMKKHYALYAVLAAARAKNGEREWPLQRTQQFMEDMEQRVEGRLLGPQDGYIIEALSYHAVVLRQLGEDTGRLFTLLNSIMNGRPQDIAMLGEARTTWGDVAVQFAHRGLFTDAAGALHDETEGASYMKAAKEIWIASAKEALRLAKESSAILEKVGV